MKKRIFLLTLLTLFLSFSMSAQEQETKKEKRVSFVLRGGLGGAQSAALNFNNDLPTYGISADLGGYAEIPLSRNERWKVNVGARFSAETYTTSKYEDLAMFFVDVPVLFSYDFKVNSKVDFRLECGPFLKCYLDGGYIYKDKTITNDNGIYEHTDVIDPMEHPSVRLSRFNGGIIGGGGFYYKDFYFGASYNFLFEWYAGYDFRDAININFAYRF